MKDKTFNAVKFMRDTRNELSKRYLKEPAEQERDLSRIRKKYGKFKRTADNKQLKNVHSF